MPSKDINYMSSLINTSFDHLLHDVRLFNTPLTLNGGSLIAGGSMDLQRGSYTIVELVVGPNALNGGSLIAGGSMDLQRGSYTIVELVVGPNTTPRKQLLRRWLPPPINLFRPFLSDV